MYKIIGADQKEYGPVTADQLRQWISEGRVNGNTKIQVEGAAVWKLVSELPEFAAALPIPAPPVAGIPSPVTMAPPVAKPNQLAVWSMVVGILGLICCQILGPVSIVLGCVALSQIKANPQQDGSGFAIAGIVLGILALIIMAVFLVLFISFPDYLRNLPNSLPQ